MLSTIVNYFKWLIEFFQTIFDFVMSIIEGLLNILKSLPIVVDMLSGSIGYLPSTIAAFATITVTISIVYLIVGRHTGG